MAFTIYLCLDNAFQGEAYSYKHSLCLQEYHVEELPPDSAKKLYGFNLVHHLQKNVYTLLAPSEQEKRRWINAVEDALYVSVVKHAVEIIIERPI